MTKKDPRRSTSLIAHDYQPPAGFRAVQPPVHKASTVVFADTAALRARSWKEKTGYTYGLLGTPTTFTLEERIATLEGGVADRARAERPGGDHGRRDGAC